MGHCISVIIIRESNIKEGYKEYISLPQGFALLPQQEDKSMLIEPYLEIDTDYFGGCGEQYATLFINNKVEEIETRDPIDEGLKMLGVISNDDMDEFDTINLGRYRDYSDIEKKLPSYKESQDVNNSNEPLLLNFETHLEKDENGNYIIRIPEIYTDSIDPDTNYNINIEEDIL